MTEKTQKVDPSVSEMELYKKGEPRGSVPIAKTMEKPLAYRTGGKKEVD